VPVVALAIILRNWRHLIDVTSDQLPAYACLSPPELTHANKLANDGVDTRALQAHLGHRAINSTVRYAALSADRFEASGPTSAIAN
jgi:site-specific recombinase XerD